MSQTIVEQLLIEANRREISIPKLAKALGIPADRIYKWKQGEGNPKGADIEKIKAWITVEEIPDKLEEPPVQYGRSLLEESVRNLSEASRIHAENDRINAKNIERLIALLEKSNLSELSKSQQGSFGPEGQTAGNGFSPVSRQSEDSKKKADK